MNNEFRIEKDSMGEVAVPAAALYGAQTQRAVDNFRISPYRFHRLFLQALAQIKQASALANHELGLLPEERVAAIAEAAAAVADGRHDGEFPLDIFQTGSGTSTNMNANEVIAALAERKSGIAVHPNDDVNMSQSSNDVIPSAIHVSTAAAVRALSRALEGMLADIDSQIEATGDVVKTGRTHLMDAVPVTLGQEMEAWRHQLEGCRAGLREGLAGLSQLPLGGTAVGTGLNAHPRFGEVACRHLSDLAGTTFASSSNHFARIAGQEAAADAGSRMRSLAVCLMKIANDLRWMNSGPIAGLGEVTLQALQPGSSIMPGKINPVAPEAAAMVCAQVMGNDVTVGIAAQSGVFQLNVMLPVIAHNLLESAGLLTGAVRVLGSAIANLTVNRERIEAATSRNPILVTALNPVIGYELGASIAKRAYAEDRSLKDVALEMTDLSAEELDRLLDPAKLTKGGIAE
ncbi:MAG: class II fumarate hydratase [Caldilineaceae bacterium]|nr:class II fumarate hydratase [Caldilineaceae bacterium]